MIRRWILVFAAALVLTSPIAAENWANRLVGGKPRAPRVIKFGVVNRGARLVVKIPIRNTRAVPVQVTNLRYSCGCLRVTATSNAIQPNQVGSLQIQMDSTRLIGRKYATVLVSFGPGADDVARVSVWAETRP